MFYKVIFLTLLSISFNSFSQLILTDNSVIIGKVEWLKWDTSPSLTIEEFEFSEYKRNGWQIANQFQILNLLDVFQFEHTLTADLSSSQYMSIDTPLNSTDDPSSQFIYAFGDVAQRVGRETYEGDYYQSTSARFIYTGDVTTPYGHIDVSDEWEEPPQYGRTPYPGSLRLNAYPFNTDSRIGLALFRPINISEPSSLLNMLGVLVLGIMLKFKRNSGVVKPVFDDA